MICHVSCSVVYDCRTAVGTELERRETINKRSAVKGWKRLNRVHVRLCSLAEFNVNSERRGSSRAAEEGTSR